MTTGGNLLFASAIAFLSFKEKDFMLVYGNGFII